MSQGPYKALVIENRDPDKACRVKVACPDLFWDPYQDRCIDSGWCEASLSAGGGQGTVQVPPVGTAVYIYVEDSSEEGELWQLTYTGGPVERTKGEEGRLDSGAPDVAQGVDDETAAAFKGGAVDPATGVNTPRFRLPHGGMRISASEDNDGVFDQIEEPSEDLGGVNPQPSDIPGLPNTPNEGEYPHNRVFKSPGGILTELDDTPGAERIHIWHPSGSYYEVNAAGTAVERSANKFTETANRSEIVKGSRKQYIGDNHLITVNANELKKVKGRQITVASQIGLQARSKMLLNSEGDMTIRCQGSTLQEHVGGRKLEVCGKDVISRYEKDESVFAKAQTSFGSDVVLSFFALNMFPALDLLNCFPARLVRAQLPAAVSVPLPGYGTGMCGTINLGPGYAAILGPTMAHFEFNNPINLAALTGTAGASPNPAEGVSIRAPSVVFKTQVPVVGLIPASPLTKWNLGNIPATGMQAHLVGILAYIVELETQLVTMVANIELNSVSIAALSTEVGVGAAVVASSAAAVTTAAMAAGVTAARVVVGAAMTTNITAMNNPVTPGYTVAVRSQ
jgi:hypothetical protein